MDFLRILAGLALCTVSVAQLSAAERNRVVSQTVGTDEFLLAVAEPEEVACLSHLADNAEFSAVAREAKPYPHLAAGADSEAVLSHAPTLVLFADYSRPELRVQVERAGVAVFVLDRYATLDDACENLRRIAALLGPRAQARAAGVVESVRKRERALALKLANVPRVKVLAPSTYGLISGSETTFDDLCEHAGAENVAASVGHLKGHVTQPSEAMLEWPVECVVIAGASVDEAIAPYLSLPPYRFMQAVSQKRVALIEPWQMSCVSHLRIEAYERLARELHPEQFR